MSTINSPSAVFYKLNDLSSIDNLLGGNSYAELARRSGISNDTLKRCRSFKRISAAKARAIIAGLSDLSGKDIAMNDIFNLE